MSPAVVNLVIIQGATYRKTFVWKTGDPAVPVDLTGSGALMHIRKKITDEDPPLLIFSTANGRILMDAEGRIELYLTDEETAAITWKAGVYDLDIALANGEVRKLLKGSVSVEFEVTRG